MYSTHWLLSNMYACIHWVLSVNQQSYHTAWLPRESWMHYIGHRVVDYNMPPVFGIPWRVAVGMHPCQVSNLQGLWYCQQVIQL